MASFEEIIKQNLFKELQRENPQLTYPELVKLMKARLEAFSMRYIGSKK